LTYEFNEGKNLKNKATMKPQEKPTVARPAQSPGADAEARERFEKALRELDAEFKPWTDAIQESERLSEDDFAIRINARD
jgi:hypothetical protein